MELQIQDLVASIRKEGVEAAKNEAEAIIAEAKAKADAIIAKAKTDAEAEKEAAERDISLLKESAETGVKQAQRDALISFKTAVQGEYEKILGRKVRENLSGKAIAELIKAAVSDENMSSYTVEINEADEEVSAELADEIRKGLTIKPVKGVKAGFRLASKDGTGYFDCSDEEIMQMLAPFFRKLDF